MKTLIEKSIEIVGIMPAKLTIFNITEESEKRSNLYKRCTGASGRNLRVNFKYTEDSEEKESYVRVNFPKTTNEEDIKDAAMTAINDFLNN